MDIPHFIETNCLSLIMIFLGVITSVIYPKKPNYWIGFRTEYALSSLAAWKKAQVTFSKNVFIGGICSLFICWFISMVLSNLEMNEKTIDYIVLLISLLFLVSSVFYTDRMLRKDLPSEK